MPRRGCAPLTSACPCARQVEERKNSHINELMKQHEAAFGEIKNYYNDITANNLDLIKVGWLSGGGSGRCYPGCEAPAGAF